MAIDEKNMRIPAEQRKRQPLFHMIKRSSLPLWHSAAIRAGAILLALVFTGLLTLLVTGKDPILISSIMFDGAFGNSFRIWVTMQNVAVLLCISLALTPAFKMRFWNTGAEGQVLVGCLATAVCMFTLGGKVSEGVLILIMTVAAIGSGIVWGIIPAFFKARFGTNETLFTLMMNYIAIQFVEFFLKVADKSGSNTVGPNLLSHGWIPALFGEKYLLNILLVAVLTVLMYIYLCYSKHGYEISVVGESEKTARYIGVNVSRVILRTMALSGGICGFVGLMLVGATSHSIDANLAGGYGFTGIMVSWLAQFNPFVMVFASLLIVFLQRGAGEVSTVAGLNQSFSDIITGILLFFIIGSEFFIRYQLVPNQEHAFFAKKQKREEQ